jgi:hypothetical protein
MTSYNFKEIAPIPEAGQLVDIVLSKTNRKTPTVVSIIFLDMAVLHLPYF